MNIDAWIDIEWTCDPSDFPKASEVLIQTIGYDWVVCAVGGLFEPKFSGLIWFNDMVWKDPFNFVLKRSV